MTGIEPATLSALPPTALPTELHGRPAGLSIAHLLNAIPGFVGQVVVDLAKPKELYRMPAVPFIIIIWLAMAGGFVVFVVSLLSAETLS